MTEPVNDINLTPKEAAARLKVSEKTLATWRQLGHGPRFFFANPDIQSSPRYPLSEIEAIEKNLLTHN